MTTRLANKMAELPLCNLVEEQNGKSRQKQQLGQSLAS